MEKLNWGTKNKFSIILFLIYCIFTLILVFHHEVWADEAQVWQLCRHLSVIDLFKHLVNEGHPSFFYLINMPFAKLGFPVLAMQIICWLASCGSVYLLLNHSPFNKSTKIVLITSGMFLYFFPVIARSYSLFAPFIFLLAILAHKQKEHPFAYATMILIVANIHAIMLGFASMLTLMFVWDNLWKNKKEFSFKFSKKYIFSSLIMLLGLFAVWLQLRGTTSSNVFINIDLSNIIYNAIEVFIKFFAVGFDSSFSELLNLPSLNNFQFCLMLFSFIWFLWLFVLMLKNNRKIFAIAFCSIAFQFLIYILAYSKCMQVTRVYSAYLIIIFAFWGILNMPNITSRMKNIINISLIIFFILTTLNGIRYSILEIFNPYSSGKVTAEYIEQNIENTAFLIADNAQYCISLIHYLDGKRDIFSLHDFKVIKYTVWDEKLYHFLPSDGYDEYIQQMKLIDDRFKSKEIYAVLSSFHRDYLKIKQLKNFELVYESVPSMLRYENYYIYKYLGNN